VKHLMSHVADRLLIGAAVLGIAMTSAMAQQSETISEEELVNRAKQEGPVLIYSAVPPPQWVGIIEGMKEKYPWFNAEVIELSNSEVFGRYRIESSSNSRSADILASSNDSGWDSLAKANLTRPMEIELDEGYSNWLTPYPGVYTVSISASVIAYNKLLVPEADWPTSVADIAEVVRKDPDAYNKKIASYSVEGADGLDIFYAWVDKYDGDAWGVLKDLIPYAAEEMSAGAMLAKLISGEYKILYMTSGNSIRRSLSPTFNRVVGWALPADGVPLRAFKAGVTADSQSPHAAELFVRYMTSLEGQTALPRNGGMSPVLGKGTDDGLYTSESIKEQFGESKLVLTGAPVGNPEAVEAFRARWKSLQ